MIKARKWSYIINLPSVDPTVESFAFQSSLPDGAFGFTFKWLNGRWNGWVTLPDGEVREMGCEPDVVSWTEYLDYGAVIHSQLPVLGLGDLMGSTLYVMKWKE